METPQAVVFDVNETLSDMRPMADRFRDVGAPAHLGPLWFATTLREGFALGAAGDFATFATIGGSVARELLSGVALDRDVDAAVDHILDGFRGLPLHPDVGPGVAALRAAGLQLVTLSNGGSEVAERLLGDAGLRQEFAHVLSVDDAGAWKPSAPAYLYAVDVCGVAPEQVLMVAVHPWDLHGAAAGMSTAWIDRFGGRFPSYHRRPDHVVRRLPELAERIARL